MQQRNRHLVDNSSYLICYKRKNTGGTVYTYNYAKKKNLHIIEISKKFPNFHSGIFLFKLFHFSIIYHCTGYGVENGFYFTLLEKCIHNK